jgi:predicted ATPase/class 3 adenylate cyclase
LTGERRQATIIMADVKGSPVLAEGGEGVDVLAVDLEEWVEIMNRVFQILGAAIYRYGGEIDQYRDDGLVAFFGAKETHEDDPERAVLAALQMQETVQAYARQLAETSKIELMLRVGVNTGQVIAATVGSRNQHAEDTAMGRAIALAARLEAAAKPGTIQVSERTHRLVAPLFEWQPLGRIALKGFSQPQPVYRPLAHKPDAVKTRGLSGLESPMVGRQAEIDALCGAMERLRAGIGGIVTVVGEAGLGKSRLVAEVRDMSPIGPLSDLQWVEGRCLSYANSTAYQLWLDVHRSILNVSPDLDCADVLTALQAWVHTHCPGHEDKVLPFVAQIMSLPLDPKSQDLLGGMGAQGLKMGTFGAIEKLIAGAVSERPAVVVCEDLHWADPTSLELLQRLLPLTDHLPLLFVCILRPVLDHACWQIREIAVRDYPHRHTDIWLAPLSKDQSQTLVENLLHVKGLAPALQESILDHAQGNPFYVEEILRSLMQEDVLARDPTGGGWTIVTPPQEIHLPDNLHAVLMARIDRLNPACKRLLQLASVIGRIFDQRVLASILDDSARDNLQQHLTALLKAQMIRQRPQAREPVYIFKHHLTREAAYGGLLNRERRLYHRRVAETLETLYADRLQEYVELLAHHWDQAEVHERVVHYLILAGERARQMGASREALSFFSAAQNKAEALSPLHASGDLRRIHEYLGDIYMENLSLYDQALEHYRRFLDLADSQEEQARGARKIGSVHLLRGELEQAERRFAWALAQLEDLPPLAEGSRIHYSQAYLLVSRRRLEAATQHAQTSLEIAQQVGDTRGMADALRTLGGISNARGESDYSHQCHARSLELYRELGDLMRIVQACNNLGGSYRRRGEMDMALSLLEEGLQIAQRIGDSREEALLLTTTAELYLDQGLWSQAIDYLERALPLAKRSGTVSRQIEAHWLLGVAYRQAGNLDAAQRHLDAAEAQGRETSYLRFAPNVHLDMARLCAARGNCDQAQRHVARAVQAAGPEPADLFVGQLYSCQGKLAACRRNWDTAIQHLEKSLEHLERAAVATRVGRTRLELGAAYANRGQAGDRGHARAHLSAALATFRKIKARRFVAMAQVQIGQLGPA